MGWIKYKNKYSSEFGIMKQVPFMPTAERSVDTIEIPYNTPVTVKKGYKRIITPVFTLGVRDMSQENIYNIYSWLHGEGELTTSREPDVYFKAECYSALTTRRLSERLGEIDFSFSCDSFRYAVNNPMETVEFTSETASQKSAVVNCEGNIEALAEYEFTSDGDFTMWVRPENDNIHYISVSYGAGVYRLSTEYCSLVKDGNIIRVDPAYAHVSLAPGQNNITVTKSVTNLKIKKNVRWR